MSEPQPTALEHARARWHETNIAIGKASGHGTPLDPYRYAALLDARAGWWDHLGHLADCAAGTGPGVVRDVYAIACTYAAELDRQGAAEVRFCYRIPTLHPGSDASRLGLNIQPGRFCPACERPWQQGRDGTCDVCPDLVYGITPRSLDEAASYPPGKPWEPVAQYPEDGE